MGSTSKFYTQFHSFFLFFRIFGYCPFSRGNPLLGTILIFYSIFSAAVPIILGISAFTLETIFDNASNSLSSIVAVLVLSTVLMTHFLNIVQAFVNRECQMDMITNFNAIDSTLEKSLLGRIDYQKIKRTYALKIGISVLVLVVIQAIFTYLVVTTTGNEFWHFHAFPAFSVRIRCIQNMFYVDMVQEMLTIMNTRLEALVNNKQSKLSLILLVDRFQDKKRPLENTTYDEMLLLKDIYGRIWAICNSINDSFGWSLLAITTQNFIEFTSSGYWLFLAMEDFLPRDVAWECCCALAPVVFLLSLLAYSCYNCSECAQNSGGLVHKIEKDMSNDLNNALVREFSLQIIHEPISISANGFFTINFTLLGSMAAATVTYLVILIQFQLSEKNKKESSA